MSLVARAQIHKNELLDIKKCIRIGQLNLPLYTLNYHDHSQEQDVNSIINETEKHIDSLPKIRTAGDQMLLKYFAPLRHFFLTTANKTSVATNFLSIDAPYMFCTYNDTATALYLYALKDGDVYDLSKTTDHKIAVKVLTDCLLPALKALDEFKESDIKYVGLSVYYGCKDARDGAPKTGVAPYCMTLIARLSDIQQYNTGILTAKGLLAVSATYICDMDSHLELSKTQINIE